MFPIGRPDKNKVDGDDEPAANKSGKIIPKFKIWRANHFFLPISDKDARIKATVNSIPAETETATLSGLGLAKKSGEITPTVNQATAIFPNISAKSCFCLADRTEWRIWCEDRFGMVRGMIAAG